MADNPYEPSRKASEHTEEPEGILEFERSCEYCGHRYLVQAVVSRRGREPPDTSLYARDTSTYGCLCSQCKQFSSAAMKKHFPNGYRSRLLEEVNKAYGTDVILPFLVALLLFFPLGIILIGHYEWKRWKRKRLLTQLSDDELHKFCCQAFYDGVTLDISGKAWLKAGPFAAV